ncbi:MAG: hypothetical protein GW823_01280 [Bacteroidetes bacterium]|nr:hypothetical protein [Bacteroidota bacterium]
MKFDFNKLVSLLFNLTIGFFSLFFLYEMASHLLLDVPLNAYEPEVIMDSWAVSQGKELYPLRTVGPIAGLYAPLFNIVVALFFQVFPNTLLTARLISILSLIISGWLISKSIKNLPFAGIIGLFSILIWHSNLLNFDMHAKPDSFSVLLGMASAFAVIQKKIYQRIIISALIASFALAAKQSMAFVPVGIGLAFLVQKEWKNTLVFSLAFLSSTVLLWFVLGKTMGPDLWFYVFIQPGSFKMNWAALLINFWYIQYSLFWLASLVLIPIVVKQKRVDWEIKVIFCISLFALPACVLTVSKGGGMVNAYQAFYYFSTWLCILLFDKQWNVGLNLKHIVDKYPSQVQWGLSIILFISVHPNFPSIILSVPQRIEMHKQYSTLVDDIQSSGGTVYAPMDNYVTLKAGKPIRWSYKWQVETRLSKEINPGKNHTSIALESDLVVTVLNESWTSDTKLEASLAKNGFKKIKSYSLNLGQEYNLWKKN